MTERPPTILELIEIELDKKPWQTATELAHAINRTPSTVSSVIYRAQLVDLMERRESATKGRGWEYNVAGE